jgi:hypothetical protein
MVYQVLGLFPALFPEGFLNSLRGAVWNYAMTSGNPLHLMLVALSLLIVMAAIRSNGFDLRAQIAAVAVAGYVLVSFGGCSDAIICMRYQLPFFFIGGVLLGAALPDRWPGMALASIFVLILYLMPYVFINNMRPVIGMKPWPTRINSIFVEKPETILFAHIPNFMDEDFWIAEQIKSSRCKKVGLSMQREEFEYPFWWLLNAPQSGIRLQHLNSTPSTARYKDLEFKPCAAICTYCDGMNQLAGLPLISDFGHVQYFSQSP